VRWGVIRYPGALRGGLRKGWSSVSSPSGRVDIIPVYSLLLMLLVAGPASAADPCECPRTFEVDPIPIGEPSAALSAALVNAIADGCVRHAGAKPAQYRFVAEHAKKPGGGSTMTVRLLDGARREVRAWTTSSAWPGAASHQRPMVEQLRTSRPFAEVLRAVERRPARCEIDLQGREAFGAGEEVELLVTSEPGPGPGTRLVVQTDRGELADATAVEKQRRTWAFAASSPLRLTYRVPRALAEKDMLRVFGSCELAPVAQVPLARTPQGLKLCEVEIPLLKRGGMMKVNAQWSHTWDYEDGTYRYLGSHEATITGEMRASQEGGPVALYSSGLIVEWRWKSKTEVRKPQPGCPALFEESEGSSSYESGIAAQLSVVEISKAGGPIAAAQMQAAGLTDFYEFALAEPAADIQKVHGKRVDGTSKEHCRSMHSIQVPIPYPTIEVREPKTEKTIAVNQKWNSAIKASSISISRGDAPGAVSGASRVTLPKTTLAPAPGGIGHAYALSFIVVEGKDAAKQ
jgi:hypothetical protein